MPSPATATYQWRGRNYKIANGENKYLIDSLLVLASDASDRPRLYATLKLAVDSLSKYPLPISSAEEAGELVGIGDFIAHRIGHIIASRRTTEARERKEEEAGRVEEGKDLTGRADGSGSGSGSGGDGGSAENSNRRYVPKEGSTASRLLLALSSLLPSSLPPLPAEQSEVETATLTAVLEQAAAMFEGGESVNSHDTKVKSAMTRLVSEGLIVRHSGCPSERESARAKKGKQNSDSGNSGSEQLSITHLGAVIAKEMDTRRQRGSNAVSGSPTSTSQQPSSSSSVPPLHTVLPFSQFTLHLAIDNRERRFHSHPQLPPSSLVRVLPVGDFVWLLRHTDSGVEYVLDMIAERKRVGDLVMSVKDGRMKEQRWRMKRSAMTRKLYIIEGDIPAATQPADSTAHYSIPWSTLESVLSALSVVHGYSVIRTSGVSWTVTLLGQLHRQLETELKEEGVVLREKYSQFEERMKKRGGASGGSQLAGEGGDGAGGECGDVDRLQVWGSQLRMIRGISPLTAASIVSHYPSLASLRQAYSECGSRAEEDRLLAGVAFGQQKRQIGDELSRRVREVMRLATYEMSEWKRVTAERDEEEAEQKRVKEQRQKGRVEERQRRKNEHEQQKEERKKEGVKGEKKVTMGRQQRERREARQDDEKEDGKDGGHEEAADWYRHEETVAAAAESIERVDAALEDVNVSSAHWQQRVAQQDVVDDEAVLREMRERVQRMERGEKKEQLLLDSGVESVASVEAAGGVGRKLTAKQRSRRREGSPAASTVKRSRPRRGVIQLLDSDGDEGEGNSHGGASYDEDEVQCWIPATSHSTSAAGAASRQLHLT